VDPRDVLGGKAEEDNTPVLEVELARVTEKIEELAAELINGKVSALAAALRQLEERKGVLEVELEEARAKAARPLSGEWGEVKSVLEALDGAEDQVEARMRLRAALRRIIDSVWLLPVGRGRDRLLACQVWFTGGKRQRSYLVLHRPPMDNGRARREGGWWARSLAEVAGPDGLDLRDRDHAAELAAALEAIDLAALEGA
jgi:hypothetical protein